MIIMVVYFIFQYKHSTENIVFPSFLPLLSRFLKRKSNRKSKSPSATVLSTSPQSFPTKSMYPLSSFLSPQKYCRVKGTESQRRLLEESPILMDHVRVLIRSFFLRYDQDRSNSMNVEELRNLLRDLGEPMKVSEVRELLASFDHDKDNQLSFDEFCHFVVNLVDRRKKGELTAVAVEDDDDDDDEEEMPSDLLHLSPKQQQRRIILRSFGMMLAGMALVILFSDPVVDVLDNLGTRLHIPNFYVSFILAPVISNASEILASYVYAKKKTLKTATISISTLQGSAVMNNAVCLGVFLIIIFMRDLKWLFTAETLTILFVELCVMIISLRSTQTLGHACVLLALYPFSIFMVWILEYIGLN